METKFLVPLQQNGGFISIYTVDQFLPKIRQDDLDEKKKTNPEGGEEDKEKEGGSGEDEDRKRNCLRLESFSFETVSLLLDSRVAFTRVLCII